MSSSKGKQITIGIIWGVVVAVLIGVLPTFLAGYINDLAGSEVYNPSSNILLFGIVIGALMGSSKAAKGSALPGPLSIVSGVMMLGLFYTLLQGGMLSFSVAQQGAEGSVTINMYNLMVLLLIAPAIGIVKAVVRTAGFKKLREPSEKKSEPTKKDDELVEAAPPAEERSTPSED